jgi:hypothetical protein
MGQVLDFDRARAERRDPTVLRAFGEEFHIPSSPPVGFTMLAYQMAHEKDEDDGYTDGELESLLRHAVGFNTYDKLVEHGLEPDDVTMLVEMIGALWRGDDEGEAEAPAEGADSDT